MNNPRIDVSPLDEVEAPPTSVFGEDMQLTAEQEAELKADSPELFTMLKEIEEETKATLQGNGEMNPMADQPVNKLIQTYLSCTTHGIRWLAEQANVKRKTIQRFFDGDDEQITTDEVSRLIDVILRHREQETNTMARLAEIAKKAPPARITHGLNRAQRRMKKKAR